jgi:catechol 2,3-dioxygenase-like lactoylglutathione lyase family enzyme
MSWSLDHVAIAAHDLPSSVAFYEGVFGMTKTQLKLSDHPEQPIRSDQFAHLLDARGSSIHLINPTPNFAAKFVALDHNPTAPHLAVTVEDLDAVKARLEERAWLYSSPREWGPTGYVRLYTDDPFMNTIEPNQRVDAAAAPRVADDQGWVLDHITVRSFDVRRSAAWLSEVVGLPEGDAEPGRTPEQSASFPDPTAGRIGLEVVAVPTGEAEPIGPGADRHFAVAVADFDGVHERLVARGAVFADGGGTDRRGRRRLYAYDPSANVVEVLQQA